MKCALFCLCAVGMTVTVQADIIHGDYGGYAKATYPGHFVPEICPIDGSEQPYCYAWGFGLGARLDDTPVDYSYLNIFGRSGVFLDSGMVAKFDVGDTIGPSTSGLEMAPASIPLPPETDYIMHDYATNEGNFGVVDSGYVGIAMDTGDGYYYGWFHVTFTRPDGDLTNPETEGLVMECTGYAFNDVVNGSIQAGQTVAVPGSGALALFGLTAIGRRRRRRD